MIAIAYDAVLTARYGGSLGQRWLQLGVRRADGSAVSRGRAFGRSGTDAAFSFASILGLIDPLWCCWDDNVQCLHDKAVGTIIVHQ